MSIFTIHDIAAPNGSVSRVGVLADEDVLLLQAQEPLGLQAERLHPVASACPPPSVRSHTCWPDA